MRETGRMYFYWKRSNTFNAKNLDSAESTVTGKARLAPPLRGSPGGRPRPQLQCRPPGSGSESICVHGPLWAQRQPVPRPAALALGS